MSEQDPRCDVCGHTKTGHKGLGVCAIGCSCPGFRKASMEHKKPLVVCILGSSKFKDVILGLTQRETLLGRIVINHGFFHHVDMFPINGDVKRMIDRLMLAKIELADEILVADVNGYQGNTTLKGIVHAKERGKRVRYYSTEESERRERQMQQAKKSEPRQEDE